MVISTHFSQNQYSLQYLSSMTDGSMSWLCKRIQVGWWKHIGMADICVVLRVKPTNSIYMYIDKNLWNVAFCKEHLFCYCLNGEMVKLNNWGKYSHAFYIMNMGIGSFKEKSKRRGVQCFVLGNSTVCL